MGKNWHSAVNKSVGASVIRKGNEVDIGPRIPTGSLSLDVELGGGWASGKICTISGNESSGKTAIILKSIAEFQKLWPEKEVVWIDVEGAWDPIWAATLGVNINKVTLVEPQYSEQAFDIAEKAVENDAGVIVIDSIAALLPKAEAEGDMETVLVALQARLNSKFFKKAQSRLLEQQEEGDIKPTFLLINQIRENIGGYGNPEMEPGGRAIRFYSSIKVKIQKGDYYPASKGKKDEDVHPKAQSIHFQITKNKTAPAMRRGHVWFYFDTLDEHRPKGCYDTLEEIIRYSMQFNVATRKNKSVYQLPDPETGEVKEFNGSGKLAAYIRDNKDVADWVTKEVMKRANETNFETQGTIQEDEAGEGTTESRPAVRLIDEGEGEASLEALGSTTAA